MKKWILLFLITAFCLCACKKEELEESLADKKDPHVCLASLKDKPSKEDDVFIVANDGTYNEELLDAPEMINENANDAWFIKVENVTEQAEELLSPEDYEVFCNEEE